MIRSVLTDFETGSDVEFLVGQEPDVQRIPAHSWILAERSPVFKAMFSHQASFGHNSASATTVVPTNGRPFAVEKVTSKANIDGIPNRKRIGTIAVSDVDGRAFDILLRYLYNESVSLQSVMTALTTLYAAHKYMCPGLAKTAVKYLKENLSSKNVLLVLQHICLYCTTASNPSGQNYWELPITSYPSSSSSTKSCSTSSPRAFANNQLKPTAPPFEEREPLLEDEDIVSEDSGQITEDDIKDFEVGMSVQNSNRQRVNCCQELLKDCLELIDVDASNVLESEDMEDIDISALKMIICRETLAIRSEVEVHGSLVRWSNRECKRQKLEITPCNRKKVLEGCQYLVRYLTLSLDEFHRCQANGGLLTEEESQALASVIALECTDIYSPDHLSQCQVIMGTRRRARKVRSGGQGGSMFSRSRSKSKVGKKSKKEPKVMMSKSQHEERSRSTLEEDKRKVEELKRRQKDKFSLLEEFFICLACIFD